MNKNIPPPHQSLQQNPLQDFIPIQPQTRRVWLTQTLIALFALVFIAELFTSGSWQAPTSLALMTMGALSHSLVLLHGEWYRVLTAAFLHGSFMHIGFNSLALYMVGPSLEILLGRKWLFSLFILSALGGSFLSLAWNPSHTFSVGASGGIMGLIAALFVISYRLPKGKERSRTQVQLLYMLVPALLPIFTLGQTKIDFAAHFGGAITGAILAYGIYRSWRFTPSPKCTRWGTPLLILTFLATLLAMGWGGFNYFKIQEQLNSEKKLAPMDEFRSYLAQAPSQFEERVALIRDKYPDDPRIPFLMSLMQLNENNFIEAEDLAQNAYDIFQNLGPHVLSTEFEYTLVSTLAHLKLKLEKNDEAQKIIAPICPSVVKDSALEFPDLKALCE